MRKPLVIIHYSPLEYYPPVQNLIRELEHQKGDQNITVITTSSHNQYLKVFRSNDHRIKIKKLGFSGVKNGMLSRYWNYLIFYTLALWYLIKIRPTKLLYFETLSSFPAIVYHYVFRKTQLYIHYHEYTSLEEYKKGMILTRFFYSFERRVWPLATWISHTNEFRKKLFDKDVFPIKLSNMHVLPNYPPKAWQTVPKATRDLPLSVVYVGALSLSTMYTQQFANWVVAQRGNVTWNIYSYNFTRDAYEFIINLKCPWIKIQDGVNYEDLPHILNKYDIGVILYKGHIPNYIYNAPNKLFEYVVCGLDVWFPHVMTGSKQYATSVGVYPQVREVNFSALHELNLQVLMRREYFVLNTFDCGVALSQLIDDLIE